MTSLVKCAGGCGRELRQYTPASTVTCSECNGSAAAARAAAAERDRPYQPTPREQARIDFDRRLAEASRARRLGLHSDRHDEDMRGFDWPSAEQAEREQEDEERQRARTDELAARAALRPLASGVHITPLDEPTRSARAVRAAGRTTGTPRRSR